MISLNSNESADGNTTSTVAPEKFDDLFYAKVYGGKFEFHLLIP